MLVVTLSLITLFTGNETANISRYKLRSAIPKQSHQPSFSALSKTTFSEETKGVDRTPSGDESADRFDNFELEDHTEHLDPEVEGWLSRGHDAGWVFSDVRKFRKFLSAPQISTFSKNYMVLMSVFSILQTDAEDKGFAENFHDLVHLFEEGHLPFEETRIVLFEMEKEIPGAFTQFRRDFRLFLIDEYLYSAEEFQDQSRRELEWKDWEYLGIHYDWIEEIPEAPVEYIGPPPQKWDDDVSHNSGP